MKPVYRYNWKTLKWDKQKDYITVHFTDKEIYDRNDSMPIADLASAGINTEIYGNASHQRHLQDQRLYNYIFSEYIEALALLKE